MADIVCYAELSLYEWYLICRISLLLLQWVSDYCLMTINRFCNYFMGEKVTFWWDVNDVRIVLDQHTEWDFYSASSLNDNPRGRHVAPLAHHTLFWFRASRKSNKYQFYNILVWIDRCSNTQSTALEADTLTITSPIRFTTTKVYHPNRMDFYTLHSLHFMSLHCYHNTFSKFDIILHCH